jgi:hypothetical protein
MSTVINANRANHVQREVLGPKETEHWEVKDNGNPKKAEWKAKAVKGGYQTKQTEEEPSSPEFVMMKTWIQDMNEWGTMMHEAITELRERVEELERRPYEPTA